MMSSSIDSNVYLGHWPFRRLAFDEPAALVAKLKPCGVTQAWVGSFDGLLHRDVAAVNQRLADECQRPGCEMLQPFGSINPTLPDWEDDLRRCHERHRMLGIRLHPNYHGYTLDDARFAEVSRQASELGMIVQLVLSMEDERTQHAVFHVPHVNVKPLAAIVVRLPKLRLVVLNAFRSMRVDGAAELAQAGQVWFDLAMLEGIAGVTKLVEMVSAERVLFGSLSPLFYFESAELKLVESGLPESVLQRIRSGNAEQLLKR